MKNITAVVPVRKGSQRVPNKNTRDFCGTTLLDIKIKSLLSLSSHLKDIVVSTDCDHMIDIAKSYGVKTHRRDAYFASSQATNSEFFGNLASSIKSQNILYSPVTCPFISEDTFINCFKLFQSSENVVTVAPVKHHMWLDGKPINYDIRKAPNSQDLPDIYQITYGVSLISTDLMAEYKNIVTETPTFHVLDGIEAVDIDTELDFFIAEKIYENILQNTI